MLGNPLSNLKLINYEIDRRGFLVASSSALVLGKQSLAEGI